MAKKKKSVSISSIVWIATFVTVLISVFVLSGKFSDLVTTITQSKASQVNPILTESFIDPFKDADINLEKWSVHKNGDTTLTETAVNNLRMVIPTGSASDRPKSANLTLKQSINANGDFRIIAVLYRPIVTGDGAGRSGLRFSSTGSTDDEGAVLRWMVNGASSKVSFIVTGADGTRLESQSDNLASNIAVFRIERINHRYRAFYKSGRDTSPDTAWTALGSESNASLGNAGSVSIFTNNVGLDGKYPRVVGRFDQVIIRWEGDEAAVDPKRTHFSDAFANGVLGQNWIIGRPGGAQIYENSNDNLIVSMPSGAISGVARVAAINRKEPVIATEKNFMIQSLLFKPTIAGAGVGYAGIRFVSQGNVDDEGAGVRWVAGNGRSRLVLVVRNPDGTVSERESVNLPDTEKKIVLRLVRNGDKYSGSYRRGDLDTDWITIGTATSANFGANGKVGLIVSNGSVSGKFPRVVARFDGVSGWVQD